MYQTDNATSDRRVKALQNLFGHVALFLLVNIVAAGIDIVDGARGDTVLGLDWAYWLLVPWTILLTIHLISFFSRTSYDMPSEPPSALIDYGADLDPGDREEERIRRLVNH